MTLPVVFRPEAREELLEAWGWYEDQRAGLGEEMVACVEAALAKASRAPFAQLLVEGSVRRILVQRFPYALFFTPQPHQLLVLAIAHTSRRPGYWLDRTRS